jgi:hypothetical protein
MNREPRQPQRPWPFPLVMSCALFVGLAACAGSTNQPHPVAKDGGAPPPTYYDSGFSPAPLDGGSWPQPDSGAWPSPDGSATTGSLSCDGIWTCCDKCSDGDTACCDTCYYQGTADGQSKMDTLEQCWSQAETTTCKTQCAVPDSQTCYDCGDQACATELQACD